MASMLEPGSAIHRFGAAELDERVRELRIGGHPVPVEAKPFDVLVQLARRPGETLTKDELLDAVWPGRVVTEGVLAKCVMKLRALLGDDEQAVIRTVHGFGYRMGVPVESRAAGEARAFEPHAGDTVPHRPNWRLVRSLGEGGFALVWLAEHAKTREQRVFKYARDGATLTALKREVTLYRVLREALGEGAPIVRILDWNVDEPPYHIEEEFVAGGNLGEWLQANAAAPLAARLDLVAQCAEAVADAHRVGVLHKDLKPGNVLVQRGEGVALRVLLCDFGIGALLDPERLAALGITRQGFTRPRTDDDTSGTPLYLAPEVVAGEPSTTRSDVYALGVMLYQLAIGNLAKPLGAGWERDVDDELLREDIAAAADVDPRRRLADAAELARRLRTLDARRTQRFAERTAVAENERLRASAERMHLRRRWQTAIVAVLLAGVGASSWLAWQAEREAARAAAEAETASAVNAFLTDDLLAAADPYASGRRDVRVEEVLDAAAARVGDRFAGKPRVEAAVRRALGNSYIGIGRYDTGREQLERAFNLAGGDAAAQRDIRAALAVAAELDSRYDDAKSIVIGLRDEARAGGDTVAAWRQEIALARLEYLAGDADRSVATLTAIVPQVEAALGAAHEVTIDAHGELALGLEKLGRYDEAEREQRAVLAWHERAEGADAIESLDARQNLAVTLRNAGKLDEAIAIEREVLAARTRTFGPLHGEVQNAKNELASMLQDAKQYAPAEALFREVLALREQTLGDRHEATRNSLNNLGLVLSLQGKLDEAEPYYRRALAVERELLGPDHLDVLILEHNLAGLLRKRGQLADAEAMHRDVVERVSRTLPPSRPEQGLFRVGLAQDLQAAKRYDAADAEFTKAREQLVAALGPDHARIAKLDEMRAALHEQMGKPP